MKIDYKEMRLWIENDEGLYSWWRSSRQPISVFIRENSKEIRAAIKRAIG